MKDRPWQYPTYKNDNHKLDADNTGEGNSLKSKRQVTAGFFFFLFSTEYQKKHAEWKRRKAEIKQKQNSMIPQGQAVSRLSGYYRETAVLPPAGLGNMDVWEKYDLEEKSGAERHIISQQRT